MESIADVAVGQCAVLDTLEEVVASVVELMPFGRPVGA